MRHSSIFQRLMQQPLTEARQEARQEGIEQGIEIGEQKRAVAALIAVLDARFHEPSLPLFKPTFEAITDLQLLEQLLHTAAQASTFDDVMQTLRGYPNNGA